jgi:hypothetical protein
MIRDDPETLVMFREARPVEVVDLEAGAGGRRSIPISIPISPPSAAENARIAQRHRMPIDCWKRCFPREMRLIVD